MNTTKISNCIFDIFNTLVYCSTITRLTIIVPDSFPSFCNILTSTIHIADFINGQIDNNSTVISYPDKFL